MMILLSGLSYIFPCSGRGRGSLSTQGSSVESAPCSTIPRWTKNCCGHKKPTELFMLSLRPGMKSLETIRISMPGGGGTGSAQTQAGGSRVK